MTKVNILMIDDKDTKSVLADGLQRYGFAITAFNDPKQALSQFKTNYYHLIPPDVKMSGMTGFEIARRIWAIDPDAKICFLSAFEMPERKAKVIFKDLKTVHFVKKPIRASELMQVIEDRLQNDNQVMSM